MYAIISDINNRLRSINNAPKITVEVLAEDYNPTFFAEGTTYNISTITPEGTTLNLEVTGDYKEKGALANDIFFGDKLSFSGYFLETSQNHRNIQIPATQIRNLGYKNIQGKVIDEEFTEEKTDEIKKYNASVIYDYNITIET